MPSPRAVEWKARKDGVHPLYQTEGKTYGTKPPGDESKLEPPAHPKGGGFTETFAGIVGTSAGGLRTGVTKHRYLREMDGMS